MGWQGAGAKTEKQRRPKEELFKNLGEVTPEQKLKVGVWGGPGSGKTHTVCSASAVEEPVYVLESEYGISQLFRHFPDKDIKVIYCEVADTGDVVQNAVRSLELVEEALGSLSDLTEGVIAVDSVSDWWQWVQLRMKAEILKVGPAERIQPSDYSWGNTYYKNLMMKARSIPVHLVLTAHSQEKFQDARLTPTGIFKPRWQKWTPQYVDAVVYLQEPEPTSKLVNIGIVTKCRFMHMYNKRYENFEFVKLFKDVKEYL